MIEKWGAVIASLGMILDWISTAIALSNGCFYEANANVAYIIKSYGFHTWMLLDFTGFYTIYAILRHSKARITWGIGYGLPKILFGIHNFLLLSTI